MWVTAWYIPLGQQLQSLEWWVQTMLTNHPATVYFDHLDALCLSLYRALYLWLYLWQAICIVRHDQNVPVCGTGTWRWQVNLSSIEHMTVLLIFCHMFCIRNFHWSSVALHLKGVNVSIQLVVHRSCLCTICNDWPYQCSYDSGFLQVADCLAWPAGV